MLNFSGRTKVYVCTKSMDLRKSFDSLFAFTRDLLKKDPLSGHLFVFINKPRDRMKSLYWDGTGLVLICKRLEERTFTLMNQLMGESVELTMSEFSLLLEGADLSKRFVESPKKYKELSK